jgi:uncharacterized protein (DUF488 family)
MNGTAQADASRSWNLIYLRTSCRMTAPKKPLYTIGHGNRPITLLLDLLEGYSIRYLADVRSRPYSRYNPQFNREALAASLGTRGITYVYLGDTLGGRPEDPSCYIDQKINYALVAEKEFYQQGIARLQTAYDRDIALAILCAESKPEDCHRARLIGETLVTRQIDVMHIDEHGGLQTHAAVMQTLRKGLQDLFGNRI